jgi:hypothetical protein
VPAKKPSFVSYRPGTQEDDLWMRADKHEISITAKALLSRTFEMLRDECARLRKEFTAAEMQVLFFALHDVDMRAAPLASRLAKLFATDRTVADVLRRCRVDGQALVSKVQALTPGALFALEDGLTRFRRLPFREQLGINGLISVPTLQRLGFVATGGPPAWGICVVCVDERNYLELILRLPLQSVKVGKPTKSLDALAADLIAQGHVSMEGAFNNKHDLECYRLAYLIAAKTGFRRMRVEQLDDKPAKVIELSTEGLRSDLDDGSLEDVVLAGVNAPDSPEGEPQPREAAKLQAADVNGPRRRREADPKQKT